MKSPDKNTLCTATESRSLLQTITAPFIKMKQNLSGFFKKESRTSLPSTGEQVAKEEGVDAELWKTRALEDFKSWLSDMPSETPPSLSVTPDTCDLYTLLSEFTTLKQEIKMQNREQHRTLKAMTRIQAMTDEYQEIMGRFNDKTKQIATLEEGIRKETEKRTAISFLDVRDSLVRGKKTCVAAAGAKGFFRRVPRELANIPKGYEMAIRKFDASLALLDIYPLETDGVAFDPMTMKALEKKAVNGMSKGTVVETVSGGFRQGDEILRYAQVIVAD
ncbi:Molecular chaperone GrpE (heat shock protein) [Desulfocicer vacuolatum DSM 3385]|uniref:Molecular chaperone GrpE (Heat shock protein) n=1 Tax=Desulfocicer vacuolatum DSM 3385 TaxID=1121400 RepID=A0A1W2E4Z4_9BACT|nr:nucleotide exchange factor GrpE [Desulfocicer vacuolatum]SMD04814.1 Molecular chaperone GrpE (heat shock protein) [Desulfocicer vacuolatum DSM 3385]